MLEVHKEAKADRAKTVLHEFKLRYKKDSKIIYGFVEGKDDPCFYRGFIESKIPNDWTTELWPSGNKDNVIALYAKFDWRSFKKEQLLFFVDRDLTIFTGETVPDEKNIYVTDRYSIENDVIDPNVCDRVLREICGFSHMGYEQSEKISDQFKTQLELFQIALSEVMIHIIDWRKKNYKACLDDICMKHLFSLEKGKLIQKSRPKNMSLLEYIYKQCNLNFNYNQEEINSLRNEFEEKQMHSLFTRGKYILWFGVEFCISIHRDCLTLDFVSFEEKPKNGLNLSQSNGITQIAPRSRMPNSLAKFLDNTLNKYVELIAS